MPKLKIPILMVVVAALAGAGIYFVKYGSRALTGQAGSGASGAAGAPPALDLFGNSISSPGMSEVGLPASAGSPTSADSAQKPRTYTHPDPVFSFEYPENFSVSAFGDEAGETVLVQAAPEILKSLNSSALGFQIYITPFDEPGPITPERIRGDIPDMVIESPKNIILGAQGHGQEVEPPAGGRTSTNFPALAFLSVSESAKTREVWFTHEGYLYQITGYPEFDAGLSEILMTWEFQ